MKSGLGIWEFWGLGFLGSSASRAPLIWVLAREFSYYGILNPVIEEFWNLDAMAGVAEVGLHCGRGLIAGTLRTPILTKPYTHTHTYVCVYIYIYV